MKYIAMLLLCLVSLTAFANTPPEAYDSRIEIDTPQGTIWFIACWVVVDNETEGGYVGAYCYDELVPHNLPKDSGVTPASTTTDIVILGAAPPGPNYYNEGTGECKLVSVAPNGYADGKDYRIQCGDYIHISGFELDPTRVP